MSFSPETPANLRNWDFDGVTNFDGVTDDGEEDSPKRRRKKRINGWASIVGAKDDDG
ncbi:hypothetical protein HK405_009846, partial [Cladochytrium tenue]